MGDDTVAAVASEAAVDKISEAVSSGVGHDNDKVAIDATVDPVLLDVHALRTLGTGPQSACALAPKLIAQIEALKISLLSRDLLSGRLLSDRLLNLGSARCLGADVGNGVDEGSKHKENTAGVGGGLVVRFGPDPDPLVPLLRSEGEEFFFSEWFHGFSLFILISYSKKRPLCRGLVPVCELAT